ncbi:hypothetical protein AVEN_260639-1 [Araneus ventricosus]|uniref:DDE Tnp4 domain-containing protein n=1 Tax=Araneus ventricosus TaxID=182803 RepID=A0A4Y2PXL8_ARAVE|nr:hypothetical protein AVEN_260639-1 [Araneus ventricosus]
MDKATFELLLGVVTPFTSGKDTNMRKAITPGEKLAVTLRYLVSGETQSSLAYQFRIAQNTISGFLQWVCNALITVLKDIHLCVPSSKAEWAAISTAFDNMWQFLMCIGALDSKHVKTSPPPNSGSLYYNYKGDFSIVLMALVDANLRFIFVDVGTNGRISDGGVWGKCKLKLALDRNTVNIPEANNLPLTTTKAP